MIVSLSSFLSSHVTLPMWLKNLAKSHRYLLRRTMWLKNLVKSVRYLLRRSWLVFWCFQVPYTCIPRGYLWVTVIFVRSSITHIFLLRQCHVSLVGSSLSFDVCTILDSVGEVYSCLFWVSNLDISPPHYHPQSFWVPLSWQYIRTFQSFFLFPFSNFTLFPCFPYIFAL